MLLLIPLGACGQTPAGSGGATPEAEETTPADAPEDTSMSEDSNFNAEGYPIVNEKVTLTCLVNAILHTPEDYNSIPLLQRCEETTNVHVEWTLIPEDSWEEKRGLLLASGDLTDMIASGCSDSELVRYGSDGTFLPINDYLDYMPNLKAVLERRDWMIPLMSSPDGNMYCCPEVNEGPWCRGTMLALNTKWLDNVGLDMPTNVNDFYKVLKAFKEQDANGNGDPNDEIPFTYCLSEVGNGFCLGTFFWSFGISENANHLDVVDGKVEFTPLQEGYLDAIDYLHKLYSEGLIDQDGFTNTHSQRCAYLSTYPTICGGSTIWDMGDDISDPNAKAEYAFVPAMMGPNGEEPNIYLSRYLAYRTGWVITSACETPEIAARYIDYAYDMYNSVEYMEGEFGDRLQKTDEGYYVVADAPEGVNAQQWRRQTCPCVVGKAVFAEEYQTILRLPYTQPKVDFQDAQYEPYADDEIWANGALTLEEAEEIATLQTAIEDYTNRIVDEWIINGNHREQFEEFKAELDNIGLPRYLEIRQAAMDRFNEMLQ